MDVLQSARRALRNTSAARHQKLPENWTDIRETLQEGMTFTLRHLGMTLVDQPKGEDVSAAAVKRIVATAKSKGNKLPKMAMKITPQGIALYDSVSHQLIESVSIYRISYCTADKLHDKVFAYIAQNPQNETLECHAFLCAKRKVAQAVTLTVAQAFTVAFEFWQLSKEEKEQQEKSNSASETDNTQPGASVSLACLKESDAATGNLLDIDDCPKVAMDINNKENHVNNQNESENSSTVWEIDDGLDEAFSRLAESRTNPPLLDPGLTSLDCSSENHSITTASSNPADTAELSVPLRLSSKSSRAEAVKGDVRVL